MRINAYDSELHALQSSVIQFSLPNGLCETAFNERHRNHTSFFRHEKCRNETELCNYIWALKKDKVIPSVKWKILHIVRGKPTSIY